MPYAVTLALDPAAAARVEATWRLLDVRGVSDGALKLGYKPHVTLGIFPDDVPSSRLLTAARRARSQGPLACASFKIARHLWTLYMYRYS